MSYDLTIGPVARAASVLRAGGVIAYPTEAVWGLGCDPHDESAFRRVIGIKRRAPEKGVILVTGRLGDAEPFLAGLDPAQRAKVVATWPGPVTWLLPDPSHRVPEWIRGRHPRVAIRVSAHPVVARLCDAFGGLLVSTSCNRAGKRPLRDITTVRRQFGAELDDILPGPLGGQRSPSAIFDALTGRQLR